MAERHEERLQKVLARSGVCSRRAAEELIRQGRVTVNGIEAVLGDRADPRQDAIKVNGKLLPAPVAERYLLLNKPSGYVTTVQDPEGRRTVLDLVPPALRRGLFPVGRLDYHTEGLLLLTTDGGFAQRVSHPRYGCRKVYQVKVRGVPDERDVQRIEQGMVIDGRRTSPCRLRPFRLGRGRRATTKNSWWEMELGEGRTRQIRELFYRVEHPVQRLRRVAIGPLRDARLPVGACRELSEREVELLRSRQKGQQRPAHGRPRPSSRRVTRDRS